VLADDELDRLREAHGEVIALVYQGQDIVLRAPNRGEYKRFRSASFSEKLRDTALEDLVRVMIVHPDKASVERLFERYPGFAESVSKPALELAGLVDVEIRK
jgi:hypothetical protein